MCFTARNEIEKGLKVGPRIFGAGIESSSSNNELGDILDAPPSAIVTRKIKSKEEALQACQELFHKGADFFKVFPNLSAESLKEVISQARKLGWCLCKNSHP